MKLQTFRASSMAEALVMVKESLGSDAVILHTRTFTEKSLLGLRQKEVVEVTAGTGVNVQSRRPRRPVLDDAEDEPQPRRRSAPYAEAREEYESRRRNRDDNVDEEGGDPRFSAAARRRRKIDDADDSNRPGRRLLDEPAVSNIAITSMMKQMEELKQMVSGLSSQVKSAPQHAVPDELMQHYTALLEHEVAEEIALDIVRKIQRELSASMLTQEAVVRDRIARELEKLIPEGGAITRTRPVGPHVVALIGPTGVGKTTTVAKLAANLCLRENQRVGLITIDTYRIAAVDQLRKYADIIGSPFSVVRSQEEMEKAIEKMADCHYILIDTAGRSPKDSMRIQELKQFIETAKPDEVHLVLSMTQTQACVELAVSGFSQLRVDRILFTKLDEAAHIGVVLNVCTRLNKALSYVTTGQDVPNDIEVSSRRRLAQLILGSQS